MSDATALSQAEQISEIEKLLSGTALDDDPDIENEDSNDADDEESQDDDDAKEGEQETKEEDVTWAKVLGLNEDEVVLDESGNFKAVKITVNGKVEEVDLQTMRKGFQFESYTRNKTKELSEEKRQFEEERTKVAELYQTKLAESQRVAELINNKLIDDFQQVNWQELRLTNPAEYAAKLQDYQVRQGEIQQLYAALDQEKQTFQAQQAQAQKEQTERMVMQGIEQLTAAHPEWVDKGKMQRDFAEYRTFAKEKYGLSESVFNSILDPSAFEMIRDLYELKKGAEVGQKKLAQQPPKFVKSGSSTKTSNTSKLDKLVSAAKTATGYKKSALQEAAVVELLSGKR